MILPKKDNIKENISNITSGFNVKVTKYVYDVKDYKCN